MANVTLKRSIGDAGAGIDESHGEDRLYDVLAALAGNSSVTVTQFNALLAKLDADAGVTDTDYVSTLQIDANNSDTITIEP